MRALMIDDEQLVLEGLEAFLQASMPDLTLDKTADVSTALRLATTFCYELILLDWHLVQGNGAAVEARDLIGALRDKGVDKPILVVSGDERPDWPELIAELGLAGVVSKMANGSTLIEAMQLASRGRGGIYFSPRPSGHFAHVPSSVPVRAQSVVPPPDEIDPRRCFPELTDRQVDVFRVMSRGLSDKQIARELGISEATVKTHVRGILDVVGVRRRGEAVFELSERRGSIG